MMKNMVNAALDTPTRKQCDSSLEDSFEFCEIFYEDPSQPSRRRVQEYMCFLRYIKDVPYGATDKRITAVSHFGITNGYDWGRKTYSTHKTMMIGCRKMKSSQMKRKNIFTLIHVQSAFQWLNTNSYCELLAASAHMVTFRRKSGRKFLQNQRKLDGCYKIKRINNYTSE